LYFEQGRIVASSYSDVASRTQFFALIDLTVSVLTLTCQLLLTAPLIRLIGIGGALVIVPFAGLWGSLSVWLARQQAHKANSERTKP
jgi:AAA family ATP:ADP antiporter